MHFDAEELPLTRAGLELPHEACLVPRDSCDFVTLGAHTCCTPVTEWAQSGTSELVSGNACVYMKNSLHGEHIFIYYALDMQTKHLLVISAQKVSALLGHFRA